VIPNGLALVIGRIELPFTEVDKTEGETHSREMGFRHLKAP
jgi:hypothetical protein